MNDSSISATGSKRGGKGWQNKKKNVKSVDLPLLVQGIPHLSDSFVQKTGSKSAEMVNKEVEGENIPFEPVAEEGTNENCVQETKEEIDEIDEEQTKIEKEIFEEVSEDNLLDNEDSVEKQEVCDNVKINNLVSSHDKSIKADDAEPNSSSQHPATETEDRVTENNLECSPSALIEEGFKNELTFEGKIPGESDHCREQKLQSNIEQYEENVEDESEKPTSEKKLEKINSNNNSNDNSNNVPEIKLQEGKSPDRGTSFLKTEILHNSEKGKKLVKKIDGPTDSKSDTKPKVEFISVYSTEEEAQKKLDIIKNTKLEQKSETNNVPIGPLQPFIQLVDPEQLEKETEKYYEEVGSIPNATKSSKAKCLTPSQVANITKKYPQINADVEKTEVGESEKNAWTLMHQYWAFVQENPYDFDGWTSLLNHVATMNNIEAARSAFEGFLPLYPYCFAYWNKYSELELKFSDLEMSLGVLYLGTKCVPFCNDLWVPLLNKFFEYAQKENISDEVVRGLYEFALESLGLSWHSSSVWDVCINYEMGKGDLVRVMNLYRRLLNIPNKLYNKHWDHLLALVRDYHPRNLLTIEEYSNLKKSACDHLKIKFNPPSLEAPTSLLKVTQPEDKIHTTIKEKIVASLIPIHETNEAECEKRWKYEEKIKRPYFHVKALEKKQLKMWREYLDFEIKEGDPVRIINLFERCLVPCAMYEEFWCKYTSYMEDHVLNVVKSKYANVEYQPGCFSEKTKSIDDDVKIIGITSKKSDEKDDKRVDKSNYIDLTTENSEPSPDFWNGSAKALEINPQVKFDVAFLLNRLSKGIGVGSRVLTPPSLTPSYILRDLTWEDVRQIYRRAAWIHCPSKPLILMQWAEFEEAQENIQTARELLNTVIVKHPKLLKARIQLIELERRNNELDRVDELYAQTFSIFDETRIKSCIAIRYARFLFKIREEDDKALLILRKALKKDKGNIHLYNHVFDVCYQRRPVDINGVLAAVMLALASKELSLEDKYFFCIKRAEFLREHGTMSQVKEAKAEMEEIKLKLDKKRILDPSSENDDKVESGDRAQKLKGFGDKSKHNGPENSNLTKNSQKQNIHQQSLTSAASNGDRQCGSPSVELQQPPVPPVLEASSHGRSESRSERSEKRRRREKDGSSDGHRHKKKSSKSSKKERRSSRKSRREDRHHRELEDGEMVDEPEIEMEDMYDSNGLPLYTPNEDKANALKGNNFTQFGNERQPEQQENLGVTENKPYQAVPPSWDLNVPVMSTYGYGGGSEVVKEGQNTLYERYYDLMKQGYNTKENEPPKIQQMGQGTNIILGNNNSYLPPPPMPGGILGESLFNQGKLENLHSLDGRQGNFTLGGATNTPPQLLPPPNSCLGTMFKSGTMPQPDMNNSNQLQGMPPSLPNTNVSGIGMPVQNHPVNNNMVPNMPPNFSHMVSEPPGKMARLDAPSQGNLPPNQSHPGNFQAMDNRSNRPGGNFSSDRNSRSSGNFSASDRNNKSGGNYSNSDRNNRPGANYSGSTRNNRSGRGRDRNRDRDYNRHQKQQQQQHLNHPQQQQNMTPISQFNPQQSLPINTSIPPPHISLNIQPDSVDVANSILNVPEWLIKEGGELRLSTTNNGDSIIRYWPRYMNEEGHATLFQSLRKSVKWYQRRVLVGPVTDMSEENWVNLPKLISWIGPCNYEKDGAALPANTQWPPEVVDLLHRLIHFSKSQFNSCLMSLYNSGHSHHPWHSEAHTAMAKNPTTACISLGVTRTLEMKKAGGPEYLRFPLFPGSLFVMEGATHSDWLCQIPKEQHIQGERISLSFRTMLMIKGVTV